MGYLSVSLLRLRCLSLLAEGKGKEISSSETVTWTAFGILRNGDLTGFQEFDSPGLKRILARVQPADFDQLIVAAALRCTNPQRTAWILALIKSGARPGHVHSAMTEILSTTWGQFLYKEQVHAAWIKLTGCSTSEGIQAVYILAKGCRADADKLMPEFLSRVRVRHHIARQRAARIFKELQKAAFQCPNKAHAAWQAHVFLELAKMKALDPVAFVETSRALYQRWLGEPFSL